jgi:hypothetical protein
MVIPGTSARRLGAASSITESPMAVTPAPDVDPAVGGRVPGAVSAGLGNGAGDQRAAGAGVSRGAAAGSGGLYVGGGSGRGLRVGLGDGGSTMGAASGTYVDGDGDGGPGEGAAACGREVAHPPAASRMATQAVAIRFLNEARPR